MRTFLGRLRRDFLGIMWLSTAVFVALALVSFDAKDPSFNSAGSGFAVRNYCGLVGSFLSDLLLQCLGLGAWLLPIGLSWWAIGFFRPQKPGSQRIALTAFMTFTLTAVALLALHGRDHKIYTHEIPLGGMLGVILAQRLMSILNFVGASVLLWTVMALFFVHVSNKSLFDLVRTAGDWLFRSFKKTFNAIFVNNSPFRFVSKFKFHRTSLLVPTTSTISIDANSIAKPKGIAEAEQQQRTLSEEQESGSDKPSFFIRAAEAIASDKTRISDQRKTFQRIENWELPKLAMLEAPVSAGFKVDQKLISKNTQLLEDKLGQFNVNGKVLAVRPGPAVTMFEFKPNADVKVSRINDFADDISLALSSESVRIIAPLPGRDVVGIETSNPKRELVYLRDVLDDVNFWDEKFKLPLALGKQANGETKIVDLRKMPHLLVAGTTGSGKSVFVVSLITSLLFRHSPKTLKLILIDPKQVDLAAFQDIPHLIMPPIRETKKAVLALKWAIREMERRYRSMSKFGARGLEAYNETVDALTKDQREQHEEVIRELEDSDPYETYYCQSLPYIVIVVEEFGDLMAVDKNNVEQSVVRLAQMARACGIHLVLAMQSPRKDVVTGLIKTNIPGRISFKVASKMDSRIILDDAGAERLLANGDMLYLAPGIGKAERHHGPWLSETEIQSVASFWSKQNKPEFDKIAMKMLEGSGGGYELSGQDDGSNEDSYDEMYDTILAQVSGMKEISASMIQRKFRLGYPRAARLIEIFEKEGVVGPANGSKPRQVLVNKI